MIWFQLDSSISFNHCLKKVDKILKVYVAMRNQIYDDFNFIFNVKSGRKRPLDTPKRMIERRERDGEREKER